MKKNHQFVEKLAALTMTAAIAIVGLSGCGSKAQTTESTGNEVATETSASNTEIAENKELKPFRIGCGDAKNNQLNDLAAVAQKNGYLEEELNKVGYTLEVSGFQGQGPEINAALMSGSLEAGNYAEFPALTSKSSGADTTVVAISDPKLFYGILATSDDIKTVKDLEGKKVVVQLGTSLQYIWERIVELAGLDKDSIEIINANAVDGLSLIQTGDADALLSASYAVENYAESGVGHVVEGVPEDANSSTLFVVSNKVLEENPDVAVAINKALIRTYEDVEKDPQQYYDAVGEKYGENGAKVVESTYTLNGSLDYLNPEFDDDFSSFIHSVYDWQIDNQLLKGEVDVDSFFDSSYYEQALKELGE